MRFQIVLGVFLVIVGVFGALRFSALFFGLFSIGLFLIFFDLRIKGNGSSTTATPIFPSLTCPVCRIAVKGDVTFCPQCGRKVRME